MGQGDRHTKESKTGRLIEQKMRKLGEQSCFHQQRSALKLTLTTCIF